MAGLLAPKTPGRHVRSGPPCARGVGTITLTSGDLPIVQNNATIVGNNNTINGNNQFRGLFIGAFSGSTQVPVTVSVQDLTIANTRALGGTGGQRAAAAAPGWAAPFLLPTRPP